MKYRAFRDDDLWMLEFVEDGDNGGTILEHHRGRLVFEF